MTGAEYIPGVTLHARERMAERLGRNLSREQWLAAVLAILERRAVLLATMPGGAEHYLHDAGGVFLRLVWHPADAVVMTVLAGDASPTPEVERITGQRLRPSLRFKGTWRGGRRESERTMWQDGARE